MEQLVQRGRESLVLLPPFDLIFEQSEGICEDLLPEGALILKVLFSHGLFMLFEVVVLDLLHISN